MFAKCKLVFQRENYALNTRRSKISNCATVPHLQLSNESVCDIDVLK